MKKNVASYKVKSSTPALTTLDVKKIRNEIKKDFEPSDSFVGVPFSYTR